MSLHSILLILSLLVCSITYADSDPDKEQATGLIVADDLNLPQPEDITYDNAISESDSLNIDQISQIDHLEQRSHLDQFLESQELSLQCGEHFQNEKITDCIKAVRGHRIQRIAFEMCVENFQNQKDIIRCFNRVKDKQFSQDQLDYCSAKHKFPLTCLSSIYGKNLMPEALQVCDMDSKRVNVCLKLMDDQFTSDLSFLVCKKVSSPINRIECLL